MLNANVNPRKRGSVKFSARLTLDQMLNSIARTDSRSLENNTMPLRLSDRVRRTAVERVYRTRMSNMRKLAGTYKSRAEFARVLGVDPAFITHMIGENPVRTIGEKLARNVEAKLGLHSGWLDMAR